MKKLQSWKDLKKGGVYNQVYVGDNEAYAKVNGKQTFIVIETTPALKTETLFDEFGSVYSDELRSPTATYPKDPELAFKDVELFEPKDKSEWFIKSVKITSLAAALKANLIKMEDIKDSRMRSSWFTPFFGPKRELLGVYHSFSIEGTLENPLLQSVFVIWKTWDALYADFAQYGVDVKS